jgi:hypothetical protein
MLSTGESAVVWLTDDIERATDVNTNGEVPRTPLLGTPVNSGQGTKEML